MYIKNIYILFVLFFLMLETTGLTFQTQCSFSAECTSVIILVTMPQQTVSPCSYFEQESAVNLEKACDDINLKSCTENTVVHRNQVKLR